MKTSTALSAVLATLLAVLSPCSPALGAGKLRDPTRPLVVPQRAAPASVTSPVAGASAAPVVLPVLQLVLLGAERRYAVIDGELLTEGDEIRGLSVRQILDHAVVVNTPNGPRTLPLPAEP